MDYLKATTQDLINKEIEICIEWEKTNYVANLAEYGEVIRELTRREEGLR